MSARKKLIEVALPLEAINAASIREKSIKVGKPTSVHLWWARRPMSSCRAVVFASLVDDPSSYISDEGEAQRERQRLFDVIEGLVHWESSNDAATIERARREILRCTKGEMPPLLDPFCGGGSIPLEAQRLGLQVYAADLNPVAVLVTKALVEIPPRFSGRPAVNPSDSRRLAGSEGWKGAEGLAADVLYYGNWIRAQTDRRIGQLYPKVRVTEHDGGGDATVVAWLWARTIVCPNPACGGRMPLVRSFSLSAKEGKQVWIEPTVDQTAKIARFQVQSGNNAQTRGTVNRRGATCIFCGTPVPLDYVRAEGMARQIGAQMIAIAAEGHHGRLYVSPSEEHELIASRAEPEVVPDTDLPEQALGFRVQPYGMRKHRDLFTARQLVALSTLSSLVTEAQRIVEKDSVAAGLLDDNVSINDGGFGARAYAEAVTTYLALALSRTADWGSSLGRWENKAQVPQQVFGRQTVSMVWDFAECNPLSNSTGSFIASVSNVCRSLLSLPTLPIKPGIVRQLDATASVNGIASPVICTDPPYYDNIGYADLSDYFYIWLRRCLSRVYPDLFSTVLVPKAQELVANPHRFLGDKSKARQFFEQGLGEAFKRMRDAQNPEYPLTIFYAFKQAEASEEVEEDGATSETIVSTGWETMLEALLQAGFAITGTWPMRTEMGSRMRGQESNALASSIVLICRTRSLSAPLTTRRDFVAALKRELPSALRQLQQGNIAPVDLAQAAIGPGMAVFSRYAKVLEADGSSMGVRAVLGLVNQALDEVLAEQESEYDPNTRWAIAWFEQFGMAEGLYGVAETLSKAKNSSVAALVEAGLVHAKGGKVRLLRRTELDNAWDPVAVSRLTIWEATQYLIRSLQNEGELAASALARRIGSLGEVARDLAYRLYSTCDRKGWVDEAVAYNSLVVAWPDIARLATKAEEVGSQTTYL